MLKEDAVASSFISDFAETAEVTGVEVVVTDSGMSSVFPIMVCAEVGAPTIRQVVSGVWLT